MKLITIEGKTEGDRYCEIFFRSINQMIREHSGQINQHFNLTHIQFDKHGSTKIAIKSAFGKKVSKNLHIRMRLSSRS